MTYRHPVEIEEITHRRGWDGTQPKDPPSVDLPPDSYYLHRTQRRVLEEARRERWCKFGCPRPEHHPELAYMYPFDYDEHSGVGPFKDRPDLVPEEPPTP